LPLATTTSDTGIGPRPRFSRPGSLFRGRATRQHGEGGRRAGRAGGPIADMARFGIRQRNAKSGCEQCSKAALIRSPRGAGQRHRRKGGQELWPERRLTSN